MTNTMMTVRPITVVTSSSLFSPLCISTR